MHDGDSQLRQSGLDDTGVADHQDRQMVAVQPLPRHPADVVQGNGLDRRGQRGEVVQGQIEEDEPRELAQGLSNGLEVRRERSQRAGPGGGELLLRDGPVSRMPANSFSVSATASFVTSACTPPPARSADGPRDQSMAEL